MGTELSTKWDQDTVAPETLGQMLEHQDAATTSAVTVKNALIRHVYLVPATIWYHMQYAQVAIKLNKKVI